MVGCQDQLVKAQQQTEMIAELTRQLHADNAVLERERETVSENGRLSEMVEALTRQVASLGSQNAALKEESVAAERFETVEALASQVISLETQNVDLQQEVAAARQIAQEAQGVLKHNEALERQLYTLEVQITRLQQDVVVAYQAAREAQQALQQAVAGSEAAAGQQTHDVADDQSQTVASMHEEMAAMQQRITQQQDTIANMTSDASSLRDQIASLACERAAQLAQRQMTPHARSPVPPTGSGQAYAHTRRRLDDAVVQPSAAAVLRAQSDRAADPPPTTESTIRGGIVRSYHTQLRSQSPVIRPSSRCDTMSSMSRTAAPVVIARSTKNAYMKTPSPVVSRTPSPIMRVTTIYANGDPNDTTEMPNPFAPVRARSRPWSWTRAPVPSSDLQAAAPGMRCLTEGDRSRQPSRMRDIVRERVPQSPIPV